MYTKAQIFNLALGALLLSRRIIDTDTETSNENTVLNTHYDTAFRATLEDLDLDGTASQKVLALIEEDPIEFWKYAYTYPSDCLFLRRIQSSAVIDTRATHIPKRVAIHKGDKVIFTNQEDAIIEYISTDVPLSALTATTGLAIAYRLAMLSAPLITGKGAAKLVADIQAKYLIAKAEAQEQDRRENFNFNEDNVDSEFVAARTS